MDISEAPLFGVKKTSRIAPLIVYKLSSSKPEKLNCSPHNIISHRKKKQTNTDNIIKGMYSFSHSKISSKCCLKSTRRVNLH